MSYFWKKKTIVSYLLSVMVIWIHISSFANYNFDDSILAKMMLSIPFFIKDTFSRMAVPLFFIISGAVFFRNYTNETYLKKLKARFFSLVIPYFVWNILNMLFVIMTSYSFVSNYFIGREKFVLSVKNILLSVFLYGSNGQFWFVFCLIVFVALSPLIELTMRSKFVGGGGSYSY